MHLLVCFFCFFDACQCFAKVCQDVKIGNVSKPAQASKKQKNKTLSIYSGLGVYRLHFFFVFFGFLMPVQVL